VAARNAGRHFVGYDISAEYCRLAETRLKGAD
jgi:DNA modification methylase